jgi:hypothetical protein
MENNVILLFYYSLPNKDDWFKILDFYGFRYSHSKNDYYHIFNCTSPIHKITLLVDYNNLIVLEESSILKVEPALIYKGYLPLTFEHLQLLLDTFLGLKMTHDKKKEYLKWMEDKRMMENDE